MSKSNLKIVKEEVLEPDLEINIAEKDGELVVSSREVAKNFGKRHVDTIRAINEFISDFEGGTQDCVDLFIESEYVHPQNKQSYKEFLLTEEGFSLLVMGFTGKKARLWKRKYVQAFKKMKDYIKNNEPKMSDRVSALIDIIDAKDDITQALAIDKYTKVITLPLIEENDKYKRFLGESTKTISKRDLATKLDTSTNMMAVVLKRHKVYTDTCNVSVKFRRLFPDITMIQEIEEPVYRNNEIVEGETKRGWIWTYEGAKTLIDYLIEKEEVELTENGLFKLACQKKKKAK